MRSRRQFLLLAGAGVLAAPRLSLAQREGPLRRIGFLGSSSPSSGFALRLAAFREGLRELGYVEGRNITIEYRWAEGKYERLPELAAELVRLKVDVLVTHGTPGTRAAKEATATIPIVMAVSGDAVANRLVASLARPGGNVTGATFFSPELAAKQVELLKEAMPRIALVALLVNPDNSALIAERQTIQKVAESMGIALQDFGARSVEEYEHAFGAMAKKRVDGVWIPTDPAIVGNIRTVAGLAAKHRIPSTGFTDLPEVGGLIGYGAKLVEMFGRAAYFVDRIFKGAKPGDLPIERASKFELIINMGAAKTLGITIPQSILVRADRVIE